MPYPPIRELSQLLGHTVTVTDGENTWTNARLEGVHIQGLNMQLGGFFDETEIVIDLVAPRTPHRSTSLVVSERTTITKAGGPPRARVAG